MSPATSTPPRVNAHLTTLFGHPDNENGNDQGNGYREWGQHGSGSVSSSPGDQGRAEAQRRAERNGQVGTAAGTAALRTLSSEVENGGAAEARRRAAHRGYVAGGREHQQEYRTGADGRAEAAGRRGGAQPNTQGEER